jgi:hypothetical protein
MTPVQFTGEIGIMRHSLTGGSALAETVADPSDKLTNLAFALIAVR